MCLCNVHLYMYIHLYLLRKVSLSKLNLHEIRRNIEKVELGRHTMFGLERFRFKVVIYIVKHKVRITVHVWFRGYSGLRGLFIQEKVDLGSQFMFGLEDIPVEGGYLYRKR